WSFRSVRSRGLDVVTRPPRATERRLNLVGAVVGIAGVAAAVAIVLIVTAVSHKSSVTHPAGDRSGSTRHQSCRQVGDSESPFACSSVWNAPLSAHAPLSPHSSQYAAELLSQFREYGGWIDSYSYSVPVYTVARDQRR